MNSNASTSLGKKALYSVLLAGGLSVLGAGAANAIDLNLGGDDGILSDSGILANLGLPITVDGNSISIIGNSSSGTTPADTSTDATDTPSVITPLNTVLSIDLGDSSNGSSDGVLGRGLLDLDLLGDTSGPIVVGDLANVWIFTPGQLGIGDIGLGEGALGDIANGTDVDADAMVPVTVENNSISIIGDSRTGSTGGSGDSTAGGDTGLLGGTDLLADVGILGGVNLLGTGAGTDGENSGLLSNLGVMADAVAPISVTCNSVSVIGSSDSGCATAASTPTDPSDPGDPGDATTPGATGGGLAETGADVTGVMGVGALALALGLIVTVFGRRFGLGS